MKLTSAFDVEMNGIVLLDREVLHAVLGWTPAAGETRDLMHEFFNSDLGDEVVTAGAVVPLLSIDDGAYELFCRPAARHSRIEEAWIVARNGQFPLEVTRHAAFHDLAALTEWPWSESGLDAGIPPGCYSVSINGFRVMESGVITRAGYEFVYAPVPERIVSTGRIDAAMRVFF
ncbi:Uncharacterised protein [Bordetella ansorpii]|uniref:Uncharacterized protein n=1 Tax=Bordetella ansorpii TaxID=288768 RepID=A0A157R8M3_9BORD|nr:hypothetical protein [Bordetella ansorpii]SAI54393.1 Uncharacterised protein [Bordetella ansorpii]